MFVSENMIDQPIEVQMKKSPVPHFVPVSEHVEMGFSPQVQESLKHLGSVYF